jgi:hypothetical protein
MGGCQQVSDLHSQPRRRSGNPVEHRQHCQHTVHPRRRTLITLPAGGVEWDPLPTNVYGWDGSNFNTYSVRCALSIGVGANSRGLTHGTP